MTSRTEVLDHLIESSPGDVRLPSVRRDLAQEVPGGQEVDEALAVLVAGQPHLAAVGGVQLGVVPAQLVDGGRLASLGRADRGPESGPIGPDPVAHPPSSLWPGSGCTRSAALDPRAGAVGHHDGDVGEDERADHQHPAQPARTDHHGADEAQPFGWPSRSGSDDAAVEIVAATGRRGGDADRAFPRAAPCGVLPHQPAYVAPAQPPNRTWHNLRGSAPQSTGVIADVQPHLPRHRDRRHLSRGHRPGRSQRCRAGRPHAAPRRLVRGDPGPRSRSRTARSSTSRSASRSASASRTTDPRTRSCPSPSPHWSS